jgi:hypothetical protein
MSPFVDYSPEKPMNPDGTNVKKYYEIDVKMLYRLDNNFRNR